MADSIVIPLEIWQAPQGDVVLVYSERECSIYFACWTDEREPAAFVGHLAFMRVWGVRSFPREFLPYHPDPETLTRSYIIEVLDSDLVKGHRAYRERHYPNASSAHLAPKHFVVGGHDIYHEILADAFVVSTIPREGIVEPRLLRLLEDA